MRQEPTLTPPTIEREIDATLLRTLPFASPTYPLLEYPGAGSYGWVETGGGNQIDDQYRNPYFAYKAMRRLDNLLTTRSNVYAVWITVGYFEVSPAPSNDPQRSVKYPDGWVLGAGAGERIPATCSGIARFTCTTERYRSASSAARTTT